MRELEAPLAEELQTLWPHLPWNDATQVHGALHDVVVLAPAAAVRVVRGDRHEERAAREAQVLASVQALTAPFSIPRVLDGPVRVGDQTATLTSYLSGTTLDDQLRGRAHESLWDVLELLSTSVPERLAAALPECRSWCGGSSWPGLVASRLCPLLPDDLRALALDVVNQVLQVEVDIQPSLVHGDFGLHNLLWSDSRVTGVLDWDNACWGDHAIDVAPLIASFGRRALQRSVEPEVFRRATTHRRSLSLQVAAAADLAGDQALREHALRNFVSRARAGALDGPESPAR